MKPDLIVWLCGAGFIFVYIVFCIGVSIGRRRGICDMGNEAIEDGVAEWKIDAKTGEKSFVWKSTPFYKRSIYR